MTIPTHCTDTNSKQMVRSAAEHFGEELLTQEERSVIFEAM